MTIIVIIVNHCVRNKGQGKAKLDYNMQVCTQREFKGYINYVSSQLRTKSKKNIAFYLFEFSHYCLRFSAKVQTQVLWPRIIIL